MKNDALFLVERGWSLSRLPVAVIIGGGRMSVVPTPFVSFQWSLCNAFPESQADTENVFPRCATGNVMNRIGSNAKISSDGFQRFAASSSPANLFDIYFGKFRFTASLSAIARPVSKLICLIVHMCIPSKVGEPIVARIRIGEMARLHAFRARADESSQNQTMDRFFVFLVIFVEISRSICAITAKLMQYCLQPFPLFGAVLCPAGPNDSHIRHGVSDKSGDVPNLNTFGLFRKWRQRRNVLHNGPLSRVRGVEPARCNSIASGSLILGAWLSLTKTNRPLLTRFV